MGQIGLAWSIGLAAAVLMIRVGLGKRMLDLRRPPQPCVSCGRSFSGRNCPFCVHS